MLERKIQNKRNRFRFRVYLHLHYAAIAIRNNVTRITQTRQDRVVIIFNDLDVFDVYPGPKIEH